MTARRLSPNAQPLVSTNVSAIGLALKRTDTPDDSPPSAGPQSSLAADLGLGSLSVREIEVLMLIGEGLSTAAIAKRIGRRQETVRSHRRAIGKKLGISNRVELARFAIRAGLCSVRAQSWLADGGQPVDRLWLLAAAIRSTTVPLAIVSPAGQILFANDALLGLFRFDAATANGLPLSMLLPQETAAETLRDKLLSDEGYTGEMTMVRPGGGAICVALNTAPLRDEGGHRIGFTVAASDITERQLSTARLAAATNSLETLVRERTGELENVVQLLRREIETRRSAEDRLHRILEGVAAATGASFFELLVGHLAQALGVKYAAVVELIPGKPSRARAVAFWNGDHLGHEREFELAGSVCEMVLEGRPCFYPSGVRTLFGPNHVLGQISVESYLGVALTDSEGRRMGVLAVMDDTPMPHGAEYTTILRAFAARAAGELERRRTEEAHRERAVRDRLLNDLTPVGLFITDPSFTCTYVNARWREITGLRTNDPPSRLCESVLHPSDRERVLQTVHRAVATAEPFESTHRIRRPDGTAVRVVAQARPHFGAGGELLGFVGSITELGTTSPATVDDER